MASPARRLERVYADWSRGDFRAGAEVLDPEVEWRQAASSVEPGTRHGRDEVAAMTRNVFEAFRDFRVEPVRFIELDDRVIVVSRMRGTARGTGLELDRPSVQLWTFSGDSAKRVEWFDDEESARAAAEARR